MAEEAAGTERVGAGATGAVVRAAGWGAALLAEGRGGEGDGRAADRGDRTVRGRERGWGGAGAGGAHGGAGVRVYARGRGRAGGVAWSGGGSLANVRGAGKGQRGQGQRRRDEGSAIGADRGHAAACDGRGRRRGRRQDEQGWGQRCGGRRWQEQGRGL